MKLDTLIGIPEAARAAKTPERTMRRRLRALDQKLRSEGKPAVLVRIGERVWKVRAEALRAALYTEERAREAQARTDARVDSLESTVGATNSRLVALRNSHQAEKRRQENRWAAQERVNSGITEALAGMAELGQGGDSGH